MLLEKKQKTKQNSTEYRVWWCQNSQSVSSIFNQVNADDQGVIFTLLTLTPFLAHIYSSSANDDLKCLQEKIIIDFNTVDHIF